MVDIVNLKNMNEQNLLGLYSMLMKELRDRGLIRSSNNPVADYAEKVAVEYMALLLDDVKKKKVFRKDKIVKWHCRNCGYVHEGKGAPQQCPACKHPRAYYEVLAQNY